MSNTSHHKHTHKDEHSHQKDKPSPTDADAQPANSVEVEKTDQAKPEVANSEAAPKESPRVAKTIAITDIELEQLKKELAEFKDKYLRTLAESENARKRLQKEKQEMIQYALQNVIVDFLSPIDHMENALKFTQQMSDDVKHWGVGFQMILSQFKDVLTSNGVTPFESKGKSFDPHRHEAIESVATAEVAPGTVVEESLKGYIMGDKVIRPARVKVAKAQQTSTENTTPEDETTVNAKE